MGECNGIAVDTVRSYTASDGYKLVSGKAGVGVSFSGADEGALFPLVFTWTFSSADLSEILGYSLAGRTITPELADEIFDSMRIDFKGADSSWPVVGSGGVKASDAMSAGALSLSLTEGGSGLRTELTAYLANVTASGGNQSSGMSTASGKNDGPQILDGILVVPDGIGNDNRIYGTMLMAGKSAASTETGGSAGNETKQNGSKNVSGSSGGGGCWSFGFILMMPALILAAKRRK